MILKQLIKFFFNKNKIKRTAKQLIVITKINNFKNKIKTFILKNFKTYFKMFKKSKKKINKKL